MVISYPEKSDFVIIVNFTSWREDKDQACIVEPSDHAFIKKRSVVNYLGAKSVHVNQIERLISSGLMVPHEKLSDKLLDRIFDCSLDSQIEMGFFDTLCEQNLIKDDI